ncbi:4261_t:CDS:2, partial [Funneliformis mosseae]
MTSSVAIGREFEQKNVDLLKAKNVQWKGPALRGRFFPVSEIPNSVMPWG